MHKTLGKNCSSTCKTINSYGIEISREISANLQAEKHFAFMSKLNPENINRLLIIAALAMLPIYQGALSLVLAGLILNAGYAFWKTRPARSILASKFLKWSVLYALIYIIGMIGAEHLQSAKFDVVQKISVAFLAFLMLAGGINRKALYKPSAKAFIWANLAALVACFGLSFQTFLQHGDWHAFYYVNLSHFMHTGYFSMYLAFCIAMLLIDFGTDQALFNRTFSAFLIIFFSLGIYLLASKSGIITLTVIILAFALRWVHHHVKSFQMRGLIGFIALIFSLILVFLPGPVNRLNTIVKDIRTYRAKDDHAVDTAGQRILIWQSAWAVIQDNFWFGTGLGNDNDALHAEYERRGYNFLLEKKLNAHNQFLQTFLALGVGAFLYFIVYMSLPIFYGIKNRDFLLLLFGLIILINSLTESILNRQAGIVFWTIWGTLLFTFHQQKEQAQVQD